MEMTIFFILLIHIILVQKKKHKVKDEKEENREGSLKAQSEEGSKASYWDTQGGVPLGTSHQSILPEPIPSMFR